ncbi:spermatogenesis-associated serine-rich protein 2 isoform X1 [Accipiter gentilis]|uniref:spermatogenesis-associated serine-rich protein 2 isoform X1 n=1 Tax=Astur gentilis TaxID=8957 RepID=UPI002110B5B5|nr:spermatogenesis-associated serine-rich protein 2 isoform X1 [Accipiter gentilis]XP_049674812.1 spermatogenesis-associated serine-rich protein 2 isoform X1 [Accipiter gentilis]XP_049674813.1 spermatogenesis-associated serine-rich protein 2 isoform X1 [Accipiter gentilis]XP_049674814.1 spermatogenesis-associated serine-rich protein 2 isoform X1 [Accipiter gentilis]
MSKKQNTKDLSGFIFDVQSNTVMAQGGTFENMKEKISAVRAIVPNRSNNEIVLVLQHFDNCVDKTVQAFMEGNASEVLKEWTVTGKKKNKKKKTKAKPQAESSPGLPDPGKLVSTEEEQSANSEKGGINGFHVNGCAHDTESVDSLSEGLDALSIDARELEDCESAAPDMPDRTAVPELENGIADFDKKSLIMHPSQSPASLRQRPEQRSTSRSLSRSTASNSTPASLSVTRLEDVPVSPANKKLGSNIEKSVKDLQRCTVSLARYRVVVKEEMDASIKKMKQAFAELQSSLMDREVALLAEMDKVKAEAMEILVSRQKKAEALKKMTDVAVRMSEEQLVELRADIKHFVSERKYDEDLGRVARFTCDLDALKKSIASFGQVSHPKNSYSTRSRCSSVMAASLSGSSETSAPSTPACASASAASLTTASKKPSSSAEAAVGNAGGRPPQPSREGFQGNRRPGAGPRSQGQRHIGPPGRSNNGNRHKNGPGQAHGRRQTSPLAASTAASPGQTQPTGTSGASAQPGRPGPPPSGTESKGLPQRKPRASRQEGANS